jgi:acetyl esterase/lipase
VTEAFTGSPSRQSRRIVAGLRVVRAISDFLRVDLIAKVAPLTVSTSPPRRLARQLEVNRSEFGGIPVWTMRSGAGSNHVVCLHGGAYIHQATKAHWRHYAELAAGTGASVVVPIYPLAPKGTAATVVPRIADLISQLTSEHGAHAVGVYGDSAGGGLALAACQELVRRGAATPASLVLVSPWLDVTLTHPDIDRIDDPALCPETLRKAGLRWAGDLDPTHPLVSPLFGALDGLPPVTVYSGSLDILCVDAIRLRARAKTAGADMTFVLREGLIHNWAMAPLPEGAAVQPDICGQLSPSM